MNNNNSYPEKYEIIEVCSNFIKRHILNSFMQERGIFAINASTEDIGTILSHCILEESSIEELRANAYQISSKLTLSGFTIKSISSSSLSLNEIYENMRDNNRALLSKGYKLGNLIVENRNDVQIYRGRLDYEIKKPGRIQFMEKEESHCDFVMYENQNKEWKIEVDCTRSSDGKEVQKLFSQFIDKGTTSMSSLNIDNLNDKQTIKFFDALINKGMSEEWRFADVIALTFRRGRDGEEISDEEVSQEGEKERAVLSGIRQAILEGGGLRENEFVKQFEKSGCIFTAMTFEYSNKNTPETIHIRAEFKGNPKIFEVSIIDYFETKGTAATRETALLSQKKNLKIRSDFWNRAYNIFAEIVRNKHDKMT